MQSIWTVRQNKACPELAEGPCFVQFQREGFLSSTQRLFGPGQTARWHHPYAPAVLFGWRADAPPHQVDGEQIRR